MKKYTVIFLLLACCTQLQAQPWIKRVKDIYKGKIGSLPKYPHEYNGQLYFFSDDSTHGYELWVSDGTEAGTQLVKDLYPGEPGGGGGGPITVTNGKMYFLGNAGTPGVISICESDGTETGTKKLVDQMVYQRYLTPLNNLLIFNSGYNITSTEELWVCDGTEAGTFPLTNFDMQTYSHTVYNNKVYFTPSEFNGVTHTPWVTDGTVAGTHRLKDIDNASEFTEYNGLLYFRGREDAHGYELWRTDGTEAGTVIFKDILPGTSSSGPALFKVLNNKLYFFTYITLTFPLYYNQLWVTDDDPNNMSRILDSCLINHEMFAFNNKIFFSADSTLWVSDGTRSGTKIYNKDVYLSYSDNTAVWNEKLFFWGYKKNSTGTYEYNLYWTDGVSGDVLPVVAKPFLQRPFTGYRELIVAGNTLFFTAEKEDDSSGIELWKIVDFPANVADIKTTQPQLLYPNPANNTFSIKSSARNITVQLYSVSGQLVLTTKQTENIDIKHLAAGLYFAHIITKDGKETIEQLVKE